MQLFGALVLFTTLSTACGLKCYFCTPLTSNCTDTIVCPDGFDRCSSVQALGIMVTKGCINEKLCVGGKLCCEGDLCNSAALTGPSAILLLVSSAIITPFL
ncbi:CD59 glycoprotein-like [Limanda limanda]|uniref:CD59 glycoprotein-like n=1 Tax=Limanda limanda TaxID=27771 RepID=UPI0029C91E76|nr:CD59 glycoprotein-like [Limanda limanda]